MCDVRCESQSCLDTSLGNCFSERGNDSTVFVRLVLCVLSAFFSVSGTYRCRILKIKTITKNLLTRKREGKVGIYPSDHHFIIEANSGLQVSIQIQYLFSGWVLIFALATDRYRCTASLASGPWRKCCCRVCLLHAAAAGTTRYCRPLLQATTAVTNRRLLHEGIIISFDRKRPQHYELF